MPGFFVWATAMIYLFTDFGNQGPYVGELHAVLARMLPEIRIIDLMHDAPVFNPRASAYLLKALSRQFQSGDLCLAVVDPGVGMAARRALLIEADGVRYCGPDNGLFSQIVRTASNVQCQEILWRPQQLSASFHGRDVFAPALALHAQGAQMPTCSIPAAEIHGCAWPLQLDEIIYFDHFGNAVMGRRTETLQPSNILQIGETQIRYARTFAEVAPGELFWYENSMGLAEVVINQGSAQEKLGLTIGDVVSVTGKNV